VLAAAYLALNQRGEGSSPSGPTCTRDVTVASLLAMQDLRVRFPLGALAQDVGKGVLASPVVQQAGHSRDMGKIAGSNPAGTTDGVCGVTVLHATL
jgi:hypothetical protein